MESTATLSILLILKIPKNQMDLFVKSFAGKDYNNGYQIAGKIKRGKVTM